MNGVNLLVRKLFPLLEQPQSKDNYLTLIASVFILFINNKIDLILERNRYVQQKLKLHLHEYINGNKLIWEK